MANQKIEREVQSISTQEQSSADFNGWNLQFTISKNIDIVVGINIYGQKEQHNVNVSVQENGYVNVGFSHGGRDDVLNAALLDEIDIIRSQAM